MPVEIAEKVLSVAGLYLAGGVAFAFAFFALGLRRVDEAAANGRLGFKLLILPGVVAIWPLLLWTWILARPPGDRT